MQKLVLLLFFLAVILNGLSQDTKKADGGIVSGNLLDSASRKPLADAVIALIALAEKKYRVETITDKQGNFNFTQIPFGIYRLTISSVGYSLLSFDSIHIRDERFDFNFPDVSLAASSKELETIILYAEKPLIQSKEGNITFHAAESALAAGSNASELLNNIPLISRDPNGKILVRGKEPRILIDDKPVELNLQQLQDLLESMPGSSIEKIDVMTNPPAQFANEQGGVINITTRKGKVGMGGRLSISGGTRGEGSVNGNFNYRKNKFAINVNAGVGLNRYTGYGYSVRENFYTDSTNFFNTQNNYLNKNARPNLRVNMDYEISKAKSLNFSLNYNQNSFNNRNQTEYANINRFDEIYKLSQRTIRSEGDNRNLNMNFSYTYRGKQAGEQFRIMAGSNFSMNDNTRVFYQQFFHPDRSPNGVDSTQRQTTDNNSNGWNIRMHYDKPLFNKKTHFSAGSAFISNFSRIAADAGYFKKPEAVFEKMELLSNHFRFHQAVLNFRTSVKQVLSKNFSLTAGLTAEATNINFDLLKEGRTAGNQYWSFLPFGNISKNWNDKLSLTFSYRKTIRRPGIQELNPTIDFSDPYNIRFGNYQLAPSLSHNFDLVIGKTRSKYFLNLGFGHNIVENIYSPVRTLLQDEKTQITWENISSRKEYEVSTWNGFTISKKLKLNLSSGYIFNVYGAYDRQVRKFRNGGSFTANLNGNYSIQDTWNFNGGFTSNRFANPQGSVNWNLSMNVGVQKKFFHKRFIATLNFIDLFRNQQTNTYTYGRNFKLHSYSATETKNYRLTLAYNFTKTTKKKV